MINKIYNFWTKNAILGVLSIIFWFIVTPGMPEIRLINFIVLLELLTLLLCQLAVYIHYKSPVTYKINVGKDDTINSVEQHSLIAANSRIYQAVHLFVGLIVVGVYFLSSI